MLDADTRTGQERLNVLDEALVCAGQTPINPGRDSIARLIPKRNVETWILYLCAEGAGGPVIDEEQDYKYTKTADDWSRLILQASETLFAWTRQAAILPDNLISSIRHGIQEISRVLPVGR